MNRFFIIGCQRSGTTLARLILECHPKIFCFDEWKAYRSLKLHNHNPFSSLNMNSYYGYKIPCWTEKLNDDFIFDPGNGVWARRFYSGEPIIFLIRDVRDAVTSMFQLSQGNSNWWFALGNRILSFKMRSRRFMKRYSKDMQHVGASPVAAAALYWKFKTQAFLDYRNLDWPVYGLRYEDLVTNPELELRKIVRLLGLAWDDRLLSHFEQSHPELGSEGLAIGNNDPKRPIEITSIGKWQNTLTSKEVREIMAVAGDLNDQISQELNNEVKFTSTIARFVNTAFSSARKLSQNSNISKNLAQTLDWLVEQEKSMPELQDQIVELKQRLSNIENR